MDLIDRSQSRGKTPWDPLVQDTAAMFGARAVDPILAAVMCDRINRPDIWPQSLRSENSSTSCKQGAVHIWVPAFARTTQHVRLCLALTARLVHHLNPSQSTILIVDTVRGQ